MAGGRVRRVLLESLGLLIVATLNASCDESPHPSDPRLTIELRWVKAYPQEDRSRIETGLLWTLSFLGATLPRETANPLSWHDNFVTLHLDRAGIDAAAMPYWEQLIDTMKASDEYRVAGGFDIGRFVALTLCSTQHYYVLTGAEDSYDEARATYQIDERLFAVVDSGVSHGHRLLERTKGTDRTHFAFIAHEGHGSIPDGTFTVQEHELLSVMPNGQLRFALYDTDGRLESAADPMLTPAGKPSKCLWCHETHLLRPFKDRGSVPGYESAATLETAVSEMTRRLRTIRSNLRSRVDFSRQQDHTLSELLYVTFYEPSAERVAREWNASLEQVREALSGLPTRSNPEFDFLGQTLYRRSDVDRLSPYGVINVPTDPREPSANEVDLLR